MNAVFSRRYEVPSLQLAAIATLQGFLYGIAENCIIVAIVEWKKLKEDKLAQENVVWLSDLERRKALADRISQKVSTNRWTREYIRAARMASLVPLLRKCGFQLIELPSANFEMAAYKGLFIKDSYWRWPQRQLAGNTFDFFVKAFGLSVNDAMRQITEP